MTTSVVDVRVVVPQVELPRADPFEVRRIGAFFGTASQSFAELGWRLGASCEELTAGLSWCGPASSAYVSESNEQRTWLDNAAAAFELAGSACQSYADEVERAQLVAQRAEAGAADLSAERARLVDRIRQVDAELAASTTGAGGPVGVFTAVGDHAAEVRQLQTWANRLAQDATSLQTSLGQVEESCRDADARASAAFEHVSSMTMAARVAAARAAAPPPPRHEDGSVGSRIGGFFSALRDDVTVPIGFAAGLVGLNGGVADNWSALGSGLAHDVTHPVDLIEALADSDDIQDGNWGHWLGTIGPGVIATVATAGGYAAAKTATELAALEREQAVAAEVQRLLDEGDAATMAAYIASNGGRDSSRLIPGGGLLAHDLAGGHGLEKHVAMTFDQLKQRFRDEKWIVVASTFTDRATAELVIGDLLDSHATDIDIWLDSWRRDPLSVKGEFELEQPMGRPIGFLLKRKGGEPLVTTTARIVLVPDDSLLGFHIKTAFTKR